MPDASESAPPLGPAAVLATPSDFGAFPIGPQVRAALADMGYAKPTDVQHAVILPTMDGRDLLVQSKTGSGKTAAFGIPIIERLEAGSAEPNRPQALILLPTRELAHQVAVEMGHLAAHRGTKILPVYGGVPMARQIAALRRGVDVIVGTPGRLLDHLRRKNMSLQAIRVVVLDEADEMLSMGFWDDVTELLQSCPPARQTLLFSATLPYEVAKSAAQFLRDAVRLDLSGDDLNVDGIDNHILHVLPTLPKPRQLLYALEGARADSAIIFCNTRNETEILAKYLTQSGFVAEPLSGNFKQKERDRTMARIKSGELRYMVATDIAARGIDIADLSHVFNYSLPEFSEVYLHRVGRTGRAGKLGTAISLVDGKGLGTLSVLERDFGVQFTEITLPPEAEVLRARSARIMKDLVYKASMAELGQHLSVAQEILDNAAEAPQMVAFLLKAYFNNQAEQGRRAAAEVGRRTEEGSQAAAPRPPRARGRRSDATTPPQLESLSAGVEGDRDGEDEESGRKRRRRRRGRSRSSAQSSSESGRPEALGYEIVDAKDVLRSMNRSESVAPWNPEGPILPPVGPVAAPVVPSPPRSVPRPTRAVKVAPPEADGLMRIRVNIGFDDGFKGRGAVAKKISALAGLNEGIVVEEDSRRDHAVLKATSEIADLVRDRVDGAQLGKKVITVQLIS